MSSISTEPFFSRGAAVNGPLEGDYSIYRLGQQEPELGVWIVEILHRDRDHIIFLDQRGELQWCHKEEIENAGWIYGRVVELEAKCSFFKEAELPMYALVYRSVVQGVTWLKISSKIRAQRKLRTPAKDESGPYAPGKNTAAPSGEPAPPDLEVTDNPFRTAKIFIGQGLVAALTSKNAGDAVAAFDNAEKYIEQRGREASLGWLYNTFTFLALLSAIGFLVLILYDGMDRGRNVWTALTCAAAGGVGAYLSRAFASRTALPCDANAGWYLHVMEALLRWSVGAAAGALLCLLIKSKVLLGSLPGDGGNLPVVIALSVLAGMSERFLPTLLSRFDDQLDDKREKGTSTPPPPSPPTPPAPTGGTRQEIRSESSSASSRK